MGLRRHDNEVLTTIKELQKIPGVGKSIACDLFDLGYKSIDDLRGGNPEIMFVKSNDYCGRVQDICLLYIFRCAVYFAETYGDVQDTEKLKWWNWMDEVKVDSVTKDKQIREEYFNKQINYKRR